MKPKDYDCEGWRLSACCGAPIKWNSICMSCGEHTEPQCYDCDCKYDCDSSPYKNYDNEKDIKGQD